LFGASHELLYWYFLYNLVSLPADSSFVAAGIHHPSVGDSFADLAASGGRTGERTAPMLSAIRAAWPAPGRNEARLSCPVAAITAVIQEVVERW
jgi:hypothetical protein